MTMLAKTTNGVSTTQHTAIVPSAAGDSRAAMTAEHRAAAVAIATLPATSIAEVRSDGTVAHGLCRRCDSLGAAVGGWQQLTCLRGRVKCCAGWDCPKAVCES